jgi:hypothetical protein
MQEAMLMGAVAVAADLGGVSESIPEEIRKFLFPLGKQQQLTALHKLGQVGGNFALQKYDVRALNAQILTLLRGMKD